MTDFDSDRRTILKAGGAALAAGLAGCIGPFTDTEGVPGTTDPQPPGDDDGNGGSPVEEYLDGANGFDGIEDMTGQDSVTVEVGAGEGLSFSPAAVQIDPGTTVTWEWTGEGGRHNVVNEGGEFESELTSEEGFTFEQQFDSDGTFLYFCGPHKQFGMRGAIVVGSGEGGGGGTQDPEAQVEEYLDGANLYDGVEDMTGQDSVTVEVGGGEGLAFDPPAIRVDSGTTVTWEWTGEGGQHNVVNEGGEFESELTNEEGFTFEQQFDSDGTFLYFCQPHKEFGMRGAVIVGSGEGGDGGDDGGGDDGSGDDGGGDDGGDDGSGDDGGDDGGGDDGADVEEYLDGANGFDGVEDMSGQDSVTVEVGAGEGLAFDPPAIRVDSGTTVTWEWTGEGGQHNVVNEGGEFESELTNEEGHTYEVAFEEAGTFLYFCQPHKEFGMRGAVVVE